MTSVFVVAKVLAVRSLYAYPCCSICCRKVRRLDKEDSEDRLWCSYCKKHYKKKSVQYRYYVNFTVADKSGFARITVFGKSLEAFFGLTATQFCRYVVNCEGNRSLQNVCIDQIIHLAMEKCFLGSMVHLAFPLTTAYSANIQGNSGSPVVLQNVIHLPTENSRTSGDNCKSIPELLASYIIRIKSENRMKMVIDVLTECIEYFEGKSYLSEKKHLSSFKADHTVDECSVKGASSEMSFDQTCFNASEVASPWNNTGINLVLSMMSNDDESKDGIDGSFDERTAKDVTDSESRCCDNFSRKEGSVLLESSSNSMKKTDLSSLQQSFLCDSNISQICTSIIENHNGKSSSTNTTPNDDVANATTPQPRCSQPISDSSSVQEPGTLSTYQRNTRISLDDKLAKCVNLKTIVSSSENCDGAAVSAISPSCKTTSLVDPNIISDVHDPKPVVKFDSMFDSLLSEDLHAFLAQFDFPALIHDHPASNVSAGISSPELFSPSEDKHTPQSCLSSTPLSCLSSTPLSCLSSTPLSCLSSLRKKKHGNVWFKSGHCQGKKKSKTLWKCMKGKALIPFYITPKQTDITFEEKQETLSVSPLLFSEDSPERCFLPDKASTPAYIQQRSSVLPFIQQRSSVSVGNESSLFGSEISFLKD